MSFENESFEGEASEPTAASGRTAQATLAKHAGNPFKQAVALAKYLESNKDRASKLVKACTPATLALVNQNYPGLIQ